MAKRRRPGCGCVNERKKAGACHLRWMGGWVDGPHCTLPSRRHGGGGVPGTPGNLDFGTWVVGRCMVQVCAGSRGRRCSQTSCGNWGTSGIGTGSIHPACSQQLSSAAVQQCPPFHQSFFGQRNFSDARANTPPPPTTGTAHRVVVGAAGINTTTPQNQHQHHPHPQKFIACRCSFSVEDEAPSSVFLVQVPGPPDGIPRQAPPSPRVEVVFWAPRDSTFRTGTESCGLCTNYLVGKLPMPADRWMGSGEERVRVSQSDSYSRCRLILTVQRHSPREWKPRDAGWALSPWPNLGCQGGQRAGRKPNTNTRTKQGRRCRCGGYPSCTYIHSTQHGRCAVGP
jgi:hypothetical protein